MFCKAPELWYNVQCPARLVLGQWYPESIIHGRAVNLRGRHVFGVAFDLIDTVVKNAGVMGAVSISLCSTDAWVERKRKSRIHHVMTHNRIVSRIPGIMPVSQRTLLEPPTAPFMKLG